MITKLRLFGKVNESDEIKDDNYYTKKFISENRMVTSSKIKSKEDIEKIVLGSGKKLREFLKTYGYDFDYTLSLSRNGKYVGFSSEEIRDPKTLGIYAHCVEYATVNNFNGGEIRYTTHDGNFYFSPNIWFTLTLSYQSLSGGSNGMALELGKTSQGYFNNNMWFDVLKGEYTIDPVQYAEGKQIKENNEIPASAQVYVSDYMKSRRYNVGVINKLINCIKNECETELTENEDAEIKITMSAKDGSTMIIISDADASLFENGIINALEDTGFSVTDTYEKSYGYVIEFA